MQNSSIKFSYQYFQCVNNTLFLFVFIYILCISTSFATPEPDIATLKKRPLLDDYYSNVLFGYNIINNTQTYASRYVGNKLNCTDCHREEGTVQGQLPLNIFGIYPQWRAKNAQLTDLSLKIRECFVYSLNGIIPPANAPEITAIKTYINYLSKNQIVGLSPLGRGVSVIPDTGHDPNPANGKIVYQQLCVSCHGLDGNGKSGKPPIWGFQSYTKGSGMNNIKLSASFIKAKLSESTTSLSKQQALDVAAFLRKQIRPVDPGKSKIPKILQDFAIAIGLSTKE